MFFAVEIKQPLPAPPGLSAQAYHFARLFFQDQEIGAIIDIIEVQLLAQYFELSFVFSIISDPVYCFEPVFESDLHGGDFKLNKAFYYLMSIRGKRLLNEARINTFLILPPC